MHIVILPALNEAENLKALIPTTALSLSKLGVKFEIVVVDDGSTDETATVASNFGNDWPIRVIRHEQNLGLGRALATAFSQISRRCSPDDVILSLDADGTHSPEMFGPLIAKLDEGFDVAVASRFAPGGEQVGLSGYRRVLSKGAEFLLCRLFPHPGLSDYTCGFRAYRASIILNALDHYGSAFITRSDFSCSAEIILKLLAIGARIGEVPFQLRYDLKKGRSKIRVARTLVGYLALIWKQKRSAGR